MAQGNRTEELDHRIEFSWRGIGGMGLWNTGGGREVSTLVVGVVLQ